MTDERPHRHEHLHLFGDGLRAFEHAHLYPKGADDPLAMRYHGHRNGRHAHPHGHELYRPLPAGAERRPIVPRGSAGA